ncbi:MAG: polyprenyl synthetase family protein, partial [Rhodospirillaceae bacterium]|nr:polyprenyl synthetase family protein [Rhodospirillaceae bacterium]
IHRRKTGELIRAAIMMPGELADAVPDTIRLLDGFACSIGLAFQIRDDLLEVESDTEAIGKSAGSDRKNEKSTYPSILGADGARRRAGEVYGDAMAALDKLGEGASGLRWIADFIVRRSR